ncbi:MAG TPA: trigger factor [Candidatus Onthousia faecavium]|nr:trigger factor [Candidatus Onthousia faecavium]
MTKTETKEKKNYHNVEIKIEGKEWEDALDKAFKEKVKKVNVDGFRKGKCPRNIYEKKFGKESLYLDGADIVLQDAYTKALEENNLVPVIQPEVNIKSIDDKAVTFTFKIITKPLVKVNKYKGLNIEPNEVSVSKEEIDHEIEHLLEQYEELVAKDENATIENGDVAIIDFEGFKDGVAFEGGKGENYSLEIGSNTFIPGFEEQLIGMKAGEEKEIKVMFPNDYMSEDLKGQEATFKVKVHEIKEKKQRELDEDFFFDLGIDGVNDEESLRKEIETNLKAHKEMDEENAYIDRLLDAVAKNVEVDIPEEMVNEEIDRLMKRMEQQLAMQGISLDLYYQISKSDEKDLRNHLEKDAYQNVLYRLMLEEIMNMEKIEVSSEEAIEEAKKLAEKYQMEQEVFLEQFGGLDMVQYDLEMRKTIELLKEANKASK